jgi:uncharacterized membrane protein
MPRNTSERFGFFTDAVFAIAMTLLVIEIPRPSEALFEGGNGVTKAQAVTGLWHFLVAQHNAYYAYLLAFFMLWIVWRQHYAIFDQIDRVSAAVIGLHFPLLLLAAFLPYATIVMGHDPDNPLAALLLGLVVGVLLASRSAMQSRAARDGLLRPEVDLRRYRADALVSWIVTGYWAATLLLVWWTPWVEILWFLTPAVGNITRIALRGPTPDSEDERAGIPESAASTLLPPVARATGRSPENHRGLCRAGGRTFRQCATGTPSARRSTACLKRFPPGRAGACGARGCGIGMTAILEYAAARASNCRVLRAAGVQQMTARARLRKASWMSSRIPQRMRSRRNQRSSGWTARLPSGARPARIPSLSCQNHGYPQPLVKTNATGKFTDSSRRTALADCSYQPSRCTEEHAMSTFSRPSARAPITMTTSLVCLARRAIVPSTAGQVRRIAWLTGAVAVSSLVAACGSATPTQPGAAPATTVTVTATPSASSPATSPTTAPSSASPPASRPPAVPPTPVASGGTGSGLAVCRTATLHIAVDDSQAQGAAGSAYYPLNFTNTSRSACAMYGYPGVSFAAAPTGAGWQIGVAAQRNAAFAKTSVRLAPGQTAHAWLKVMVAANYPAATCQPVTAHWLRIYPPGEAVAGYVGHTFSACSSTRTALLSVLPVRAGNGVAGVTP